MRHLRSLAIAAVVLMISAAVVFAGGGPAWKTTTPTEAEASTAPSEAPSASPSEAPSTDPSVAPSESPTADPSASPETLTTQTVAACDDEDADDQDASASASPELTADADADVETACEHPENHGKAVSEAAHNGPPAGDETEYRNHGEYVSSVARQNHGQSKKTDPAAAKSKSKGGHAGDDEDDD